MSAARPRQEFSSHRAGTYFECPAVSGLVGPNVAAKVITHHGDEVMKVYEVN
jgi:hypothetical protein